VKLREFRLRSLHTDLSRLSCSWAECAGKEARSAGTWALEVLVGFHHVRIS
jgi:hypothetical protein